MAASLESSDQAKTARAVKRAPFSFQCTVLADRAFRLETHAAEIAGMVDDLLERALAR
jgi:hypothetical protein